MSYQSNHIVAGGNVNFASGHNSVALGSYSTASFANPSYSLISSSMSVAQNIVEHSLILGGEGVSLPGSRQVCISATSRDFDLGVTPDILEINELLDLENDTEETTEKNQEEGQAIEGDQEEEEEEEEEKEGSEVQVTDGDQKEETEAEEVPVADGDQEGSEVQVTDGDQEESEVPQKEEEKKEPRDFSRAMFLRADNGIFMEVHGKKGLFIDVTKEILELKNQVSRLAEMVRECYNAPGGPAYQDALSEFQTMAASQNSP